ncbi:hypothetical protein OEZ60_20570 [Defluviimonas sp. WL0024]|uniref:Uncharacterized protein n=1 Tax=Albidovulum salinarum TaxID=2984153 RepID=A0ABT2X8W1_9RHOB|nr:hypothetical protein [Defluviimonas sp. WL0024]MCU9850383.1 hypothetical protein [Defluviimonas sp. WL0024]
MKSWRTHPAIAAAEALAVEPQAPLVKLPAVGRFRALKDERYFFVVNDKGIAVSRPFTTAFDAETLADNLNREAEREAKFGRRGIRACMSCDKPFESEGIHNRICGYCRHLGHQPVGW